MHVSQRLAKKQGGHARTRTCASPAACAAKQNAGRQPRPRAPRAHSPFAQDRALGHEILQPGRASAPAPRPTAPHAPVFADRDARVVRAYVRRPLEVVLRLRGELHLRARQPPPARRAAARTFIMYDCGAITLDTSGRAASPYCAAPRSVAVSQSGGREITLIRAPKRSCRPVSPSRCTRARDAP